MYISESTIKKILKEAGASRVSKEGKMAFQKYVNKVAFDAAHKTVMLSRHAKRKTVDVSDVKLACH
ncbi:MAG: NFYB/HAP3 family transcription factor subunit [Candidatus Micrarchaeota archaeon]|nr:NFYB/HAP3 family transcription factor subunit [Candidatus Micrarchaeota archaeon]